jgi:hypothetical protein
MPSSWHIVTLPNADRHPEAGNRRSPWPSPPPGSLISNSSPMHERDLKRWWSQPPNWGRCRTNQLPLSHISESRKSQAAGRLKRARRRLYRAPTLGGTTATGTLAAQRRSDNSRALSPPARARHRQGLGRRLRRPAVAGARLDHGACCCSRSLGSGSASRISSGC